MSRNSGFVCLLAGAVLASVAAVSAGPAQAQDIGDVKCQDDGYLYRWMTIGSSGMWMNTFQKCEPRGSSSSSSSSSRNRSARDDSEEEDEGYDNRRSRRQSNYDDERSAGRPEDGDEKCGPDGNILKYRWYPALRRGSWYNTYRDCQ